MSAHTIRARLPEAAPTGAGNGPEVITDPGELRAHLEDAAHVPGGFAAGLVLPRSEAEVAEALLTSPHVLPIGAQSSLTGGATPRGELLVSTARLRTMELRADGRVRAGAGVTVAEVDARLHEHQTLYPPLPTWQGATIGGVIATNAAGAATFKYGTTRAWVDEITVVLASGHALDVRRGVTSAHPDGYFNVDLGGRTVRVPVPRYRMPDVPKSSAGYFAAPGMDLIDLFIGAEGTLGIVTEATLRVLPVRPALCHAFVTFADRASALTFVARLRSEAQRAWREQDGSGIDVSAIEHMDARSLSLLREDGVDVRLGIALDDGAAMALLVAIDLPTGTTAREAYDQIAGSGDTAQLRSLARFAALLEEFGVVDAAIAAPGDSAATERLLALREAVPVAVNRRVGLAQRDVDPRIQKTAADVVVPFDRFGEMLALYDEELRARGLDGAVWGHVSDGNVHPNVIPRNYADVESGCEAVLAFGRAAIRLGGSPMAEHGVGRNAIKQQLLVDLYGTEGVDEMRAVKAALDPLGKLAPGVIFA